MVSFMDSILFSSTENWLRGGFPKFKPGLCCVAEQCVAEGSSGCVIIEFREPR